MYMCLYILILVCIYLYILMLMHIYLFILIVSCPTDLAYAPLTKLSRNGSYGMGNSLPFGLLSSGKSMVNVTVNSYSSMCIM